jgi:tetratricopeptide (TPR) repeat protein
MFNRIRSALGGDGDGGDSPTPDLIKLLGLTEWYQSLTPEQRQLLYDHSEFFGAGTDGAQTSNQLDWDITSTNQSAQKYLSGVGQSALRAHEYDFAELTLKTALEHDDGTATSTHFTYLPLIGLYYKQRDDREDAIPNCIEYCRRDIGLTPAFLEEFDVVPRIPSFKRLAIIYETDERYDEAISVCDRALELELDDGTKGGFEGRRDRIQRKLNA